jgi:hypothetical protein
MKSDSQGAFHLGDDDRVPLAVRRRVLERLHATKLRDSQRASRRVLATARLISAARREMRAAIGTRAEALAEAIAERRSLLRAELEAARDGGVTPAQLAQLGARRRRETAAIFKRLGVDSRRLAAITQRFRQRMAALRAEPQRSSRRAGKLILPDQVPDSIRAERSNPWTIIEPPFSGWWWWRDSINVAHFDMDYDEWTDQDTGLAGMTTMIEREHAGDLNVGEFDATTSVGFWHKTTDIGLLEVWIKAQCAKASHEVWLDNEWGWSDSDVYQTNYLTLRVWDDDDERWGGQSEARMSYFYEENYTDGSWNVQYLTTGGTYWAHLYSDLSYEEDEWVWISIGTRQFNYVHVDDVSAKSEFDTRWFIEKVYVESTG